MSAAGDATPVAQRFDELINVSRPLPLKPVTASSNDSFTKRDADGGQSLFASSPSAAVADLPSANAEAASPTSAGVLGHDPMTRRFRRQRRLSFTSVTPAAMEMSR